MQIHLLSSHSSASRTLGRGDRVSAARLSNDLSTALRQRGYQVEVDLLGDLRGGHELTSFPEGAAAGRKLAERLTTQVGSSTGTVLHALDPVAWAAALTARSQAETPAAVVLRFAGAGSSPQTDRLPRPRADAGAAARTEHRAYQACLRAADAIAATGDGDRRAALRAGVQNRRAFVVPDLIPPLDHQSRTGPGTRSPGATLLSLGGIGPDSGIEATLAAMCWVPARELIVAGPGSSLDRLALQSRLDRLGLRNRVRWAGPLDPLRTARLIDSAALLICPGNSIDPAAAIEAMVRCLPLVAVTGGSAADMVVDGVTGAVVAAGNPEALGRAVRTLLRNPFRLKGMGLAGRDRALTMFASDRAVRATEKVYRVALGAA